MYLNTHTCVSKYFFDILLIW